MFERSPEESIRDEVGSAETNYIPYALEYLTATKYIPSLTIYSVTFNKSLLNQLLKALASAKHLKKFTLSTCDFKKVLPYIVSTKFPHQHLFAKSIYAAAINYIAYEISTLRTQIHHLKYQHRLNSLRIDTCNNRISLLMHYRMVLTQKFARKFLDAFETAAFNLKAQKKWGEAIIIYEKMLKLSHLLEQLPNSNSSKLLELRYNLFIAEYFNLNPDKAIEHRAAYFQLYTRSSNLTPLDVKNFNTLMLINPHEFKLHCLNPSADPIIRETPLNKISPIAPPNKKDRTTMNASQRLHSSSGFMQYSFPAVLFPSPRSKIIGPQALPRLGCK